MASKRRKPESNIDVYALGTYEQMQIGLALAFTHEYLVNGLINRDLLDGLTQSLGADTIESLMPVFAAHGLVTIVRNNEEA